MKKPKPLLLAALLATTLSIGTLSAYAQPPALSTSTAAYYLAEFELTDPEGIKPYSAQVEATFKPFSGRYIVRGGQVDPKEGDAPLPRIVIIAFDSIEHARAWYDSPEYSKIRPFRQKSGRTNAYIVEGLPQP